MPSLKEAVMVAWILGIGIGAIFAAIFLTSEKTRDWSENRIVATSLLISSIVVAILLNLWRS